MVRTAFGDGCLLAVVESSTDASLRYKVQLPFGVAYVRPSSIAHHLPSDMECVRHNGFMDVLNPPNESSDAQKVKTLPSTCECMFGTEKLYLFMRLYCALVALLGKVKKHLNEKWLDVPYFTKNKRKTSTAKNYYSRMVASLQDYLNEDIVFKKFELNCRDMTKDRVYEMSALPRLVEKCADALVKVSREDTALALFDLSQLKKRDPVTQRKQSLNIADALYRIQYEPQEGLMHFCFLGRDKTLLTAPRISSTTSPTMGTSSTQKLTVVVDGIPAKDSSLTAGNADDLKSSFEPSTKRIKLK